MAVFIPCFSELGSAHPNYSFNRTPQRRGALARPVLTALRRRLTQIR